MTGRLPGLQRLGAFLGAAREGQVLLRFAVPVLIAYLLQAMLGSVNLYFISRAPGIGAEGVSAVGNVNAIWLTICAFGSGFGLATNILIARSAGGGRGDERFDILASGLAIAAALAALITFAVYANATDILLAMGTPEQSMEDAGAYLEVLLWSMPLVFFFQIVQGAQRGEGDSVTPLLFMMSAVVVDMLLNGPLIRGWIVPPLGIRGPAVATFVGQCVGLFGIVFLLIARKSPLLRIGAGDRAPLILKHLKATAALGAPIGIQMLVMASTRMLLFYFANPMGVEAVAAYTALNQLLSYLWLPGLAFGVSVATVAAGSLAAGDRQKSLEQLTSGLVCVIVFTGIVVSAIYLAGEYALHPFLPAHGDSRRVAWELAAWCLWSTLLTNSVATLAGYVRAMGAPTVPLLISVGSTWLVLFPMLLCFRQWGPLTLAACICAEGVVTLAATALYLLRRSADLRVQQVPTRA